jgi:AcrR family transcriptional regulator
MKAKSGMTKKPKAKTTVSSSSSRSLTTPAKAKSDGSQRLLADGLDAYHHHGLSEALLNAALEIVREKGAHAVSLREVARRTGVSHMAPYRHFKDKEALLAGVAERGFRQLTATLEAAFGSEYEGVAQFPRAFQRLGEGYIEFVLKNKETAQIMFGGFVDDLKCFPQAHEAGDLAFEQLLRMIRRGQVEGHFDASIDSEALGVMIWSQVHGFSMLLAENQFGFLDVSQRSVFLTEMQKLMTQTMMRGLKI